MIESNNGESLSRAHRLNPKRHNAKLCPFAIRQRIVNALANGDSKRAIARALRVSNNTVAAIAEPRMAASGST
jgi:DNA-binding NarL/FixJ family response regulator